ncbi:MAG: histidine kinase dimerization/phosphoacceptor domain -containing protein [Paracoccus sp. (in: a-proteobacteria)]|uniref:histidine kinase dimerization/phosphoacceptor domain -containing protein n=1 Tax=Paracoccus sp. TaxID=267 RepID=UPI0026DFE475|nr:histidine kinase dimerization/phosphoacceptor domain -containing protein [Paracoccus sp. (in: a-proteobacteria)]MDO5621634.1 histidine kinase dimerization/phosphoacceptor domain -containing protein [Paracoccus sp. (in: a-proteobacteria)]
MRQFIRDKFEFTKGLGFRLATLISVAILPIGLISVVQTLNLSAEAEHSAEVALLGRTSAAAAGERALLQSALGTADALGPAVLETLDEPEKCSDMMRSFVERSATYIYAGFTGLDGTSTCNSGAEMNSAQSPHYEQFMRSPGTLISRVENALVPTRDMVVVSQPLYQGRNLIGYTAVSVSQELLRSTHAILANDDDAQIMTFNQNGDVLTAFSDDNAAITALLPVGKPLNTLNLHTDTTFRSRANGGEELVYSVVPVVPGLVYALGVWMPAQSGMMTFELAKLSAILVPILLWISSLAVAYFAVYRLVLRHISELRGQMRRFAIGNRDQAPPVLKSAPAEIADVSQTFSNMARILMRDEAAMEAAVNEKTVLLKEVHHRVKNNLQLIASIINMQTRMIDDPDAKRVLRSVQDRVASLATIYRNLYQAEHLDKVDADRLIGDIINQMVNAQVEAGSGMRVETQLDPLTLLPDQAVPLSLLATEAFTNALKYAGTPEGHSNPWVRVRLETDAEAGRATLSIANSMGPGAIAAEGTGLGSQLIEAFSMQLEGEAFAGVEGDEYHLSLQFAVDTQAIQQDQDLRPVLVTSAARPGARH